MSGEIRSTAALILAGGQGTRIGGSVPKQFLSLGNQNIVQHSIEALAAAESVCEIIVVCEEKWRCEVRTEHLSQPVSFARPGPRRQDSVYNGLLAVSRASQLVCVHDGARPFIDAELVERLIGVASECGAAAAAVPLRVTVKKANSERRVLHTPDRSALWEVQTPQVVRADLLRLAFLHAQENSLTVTDDVSLVEALGQPVQLVVGRDDNVKITTLYDLQVARLIVARDEIACAARL